MEAQSLPTTPEKQPAPSTTPSRDDSWVFSNVVDFSIWPAIEDDISAALDRSEGRLWAEDVLAKLQQGFMQLWLGADSEGIKLIIVTEVTQWPRKTTLSIVVLTGRERGRWLHHVEDLEVFARELGCDMIEAWARPGWERVTGWKRTHVLLEHPLTEETAS
jgi:hypothetical protein